MLHKIHGKLRETPRNLETAMERLHFRCPKSGRDIDVGIESELNTLLRIRHQPVRARCPICSERHEWQVCDAQLKRAA